jgi:hypothetical protein
MPLAHEDEKKYQEFLSEQVKRLGSFDFSHDIQLWHYTNGAGLLGIVQSGMLYATQVSCLNDSSEIRYASTLFKNALISALPKYSSNDDAKSFIETYLKLIDEEPEKPNHAPSPFFVTCFSAEPDDLNQWRSYCGGENGYAIGFAAARLFGVPNSVLVKVNYDKDLHERL